MQQRHTPNAERRGGTQPPSPPWFESLLPTSMQRFSISANLRSAVDVANNLHSDGVIWFWTRPAQIIHCILSSAGMAATVNFANTVLSTGVSTQYFTVFLPPSGISITQLMIPAESSSSDYQIRVAPEPSESFAFMRIVSARVWIGTNATAANGVVAVSGDLAAGMVPDTRDLWDFNRATVTARSVYGKNSVEASRVGDGVWLTLTDTPAPYSSAFPTTHDGLGANVGVTTAGFVNNVLYIGSYNTVAQGWISATQPYPDIGLMSNPSLPYGAVPNYRVVLSVTHGGSLRVLLGVVRAIHVTLTIDSTGPIARYAVQSYPLVYGNPFDQSIVDIVPNVSHDLRDGLYVGTFLIIDNDPQAPGSLIPNIQSSMIAQVSTLLPLVQERELSYPFVCRLDNVAKDVNISVAGSAFAQCKPTGQTCQFAPPASQRAASITDQMNTAASFLSEDGPVHAVRAVGH